MIVLLEQRSQLQKSAQTPVGRAYEGSTFFSIGLSDAQIQSTPFHPTDSALNLAKVLGREESQLGLGPVAVWLLGLASI